MHKSVLELRAICKQSKHYVEIIKSHDYGWNIKLTIDGKPSPTEMLAQISNDQVLMYDKFVNKWSHMTDGTFQYGHWDVVIIFRGLSKLQLNTFITELENL